MGSPKWERLVSNGRAKAHGIPWSVEEQHAVFELKIPAEFVRKGVLTLEEYEIELLEDSRQTDSEKKKTLNKMERENLALLADELGIEYDPRTVTRLELIKSIKELKKQSKLPEDKKEVVVEEDLVEDSTNQLITPDF